MALQVNNFQSFGKVTANNDGILSIIGLDNVIVGELLIIAEEYTGLVINNENSEIKVIVLEDAAKILKNDTVIRAIRHKGASLYNCKKYSI